MFGRFFGLGSPADVHAKEGESAVSAVREHLHTVGEALNGADCEAALSALQGAAFAMGGLGVHAKSEEAADDVAVPLERVFGRLNTSRKKAVGDYLRVCAGVMGEAGPRVGGESWGTAAPDLILYDDEGRPVRRADSYSLPLDGARRAPLLEP